MEPNKHISSPFHSHPLRETAFYAFLLNKHFVNVSLISARRSKKNIELRELNKNRFFPTFLPAFCFPATPLTSASFFLPEGSGWLHLPHPSAPSPVRTGHASFKSHLHQSTAFKRLLKEFRCSRVRNGGAIGWAAGS